MLTNTKLYKITCILLIILLFCVRLEAQKIKGAIIAGMNASQVDGDQVYGWHKFGVNLGTSAIIPFGDKWSVCLENLYNQKGSYQRPQYPDPDSSGEYKLILDYVEVPVLVTFTDKNFITAGLGASWARLVNFKEYEHGRKVDWSTPYGPYKRSDVNILVDIRFPIVKRLKFNFRYAYSLAKIRTRDFTKIQTVRDQYNTLLSFRLIYVFNEKPPPEKSQTANPH